MTISTELSTSRATDERGDSSTDLAAFGFADTDAHDAGISLARPIPFGFGVAPGSRFRLDIPGEQFAPFFRMTLVEPSGPSFWVVEPGRLFDDYIIAMPEHEVELLELVDATDVFTFVIVSPGHETPTVNLFAPVVVNRKTKMGAQVILEDSGYSCTVPIDAGTSRPSVLLAE